MHLFQIPQRTIQNINVHISVLNGVLWDMEQVHCVIVRFVYCINRIYRDLQTAYMACIVSKSHIPVEKQNKHMEIMTSI